MATRSGPLIPRVADVELRLLQVFTAVVESGGFSAAQAELNLGQSAISTYMARLEERLGMRLCHRGRSGFALTEEGRGVYAASKRLFTALEDFRSEIGAASGRLTGELAVGVADNTVTDPNARCAQAVRRVKARGPDVQVRLHTLPPNEIERAVIDGTLHVGVSTSFNALPSLRYQELYSERMSLYCAPNHALYPAAPEGLSTADLHGLAYVGRAYREEARAQAEGLALQPMAATYSMEGIAMLVLSGEYVGFLPDHYAAIWCDQDRLRPLLPEAVNQTSDFFAITRKAGRIAPTTAAFLSELGTLYGRTMNA